MEGNKISLNYIYISITYVENDAELQQIFNHIYFCINMYKMRNFEMIYI